MSNFPAQSDNGTGTAVTIANTQNIQDSAGKPSYYFPTTSSYIVSSSIIPSLSGNQAHSFVVQFKADSVTSSSERTLAIVGTLGTNASRISLTTAGLPEMIVDGTVQTVALGANPISTASWNTLVGVYDGAGSASLYLNGVLVATTSGGTGFNLSSPLLAVGNTNSGGNSPGVSVSSAKFLNYVLTPAQVIHYSAEAKLDYADVGGSMTSLTSGTLVVGKYYKIVTFVSGDSFTNVGASSNASGVSFIAKGTTPTTWTHASSLIQLGAIVDFEPENITDTLWADASPNGLHGVVTGALANRFTQQYSARNYIINGAFDFWQRGTAGSTYTSSSSGAYPSADRWKFMGYKSGVGYNFGSLSQVTDVPSSQSQYAAKIASSDATSTDYGVMQIIESQNSRLLIGKTCTLSVNLKRIAVLASAGVTIDVGYLNTSDTSPTAWAYNLTLATSISSKTYSGASIPSTWTRFSLPFTVPTSASAGMYVRVTINGNTVSGDLMEIGEVIFNEGPVAAPFERAGGTIGGELALCQRYFEKSYDLGTAPGSTTVVGSETIQLGINTAGTTSQLSKTVKFNTKKFKIPTMLAYNTSNGTVSQLDPINVTGSRITAVAWTIASNGSFATDGFQWSYTTNPVCAGVVFQWTADAEL